MISPPRHRRIGRILGRYLATAEELKNGPHDRQRHLLSTLLHRVTLAADAMRIEIKRSGLAKMLAEPGIAPAVHPEGYFNLAVPIQLRRRGIEAKLVIHDPSSRSSSPDAKLIQLLADAQRWIDDLAQGRAVSVRGLARQTNRDPGEISRTLPLAFLAPDIVEAILEGRQPVGLTPHQLKRIGTLPRRWNDQRRLLGFPA